MIFLLPFYAFLVMVAVSVPVASACPRHQELEGMVVSKCARFG